MLKAAKNGKIDEVKELLKIGVNIDGTDKYGLYFFIEGHNSTTIIIIFVLIFNIIIKVAYISNTDSISNYYT